MKKLMLLVILLISIPLISAVSVSNLEVYELGDVPYYMDGRFRDNYKNTAWFDHGWSMLGRFDEDLHNRLQTRDMGQSTASNYQSTFWGNMAYSQAYLDGNIKYPENYYRNN